MLRFNPAKEPIAPSKPFITRLNHLPVHYLNRRSSYMIPCHSGIANNMHFPEINAKNWPLAGRNNVLVFARRELQVFGLIVLNELSVPTAFESEEDGGGFLKDVSVKDLRLIWAVINQSVMR